MSSGQEKSTQAIYTGSLLSQELHPISRNHWYLLCNQNLDYKQPHQRSDLEHLKPHTSFGTQHHRNQNTLRFYLHNQYPEIQEIKKGLHLINIKTKDYSNHIPFLCENPKA